MRVAFIGDSFVNGAGDPSYLGWVGRVCAQACDRGSELTAYNLGIRGDTSTDIKRRWQQEVNCRFGVEEDCRLVFSFGVNDTTLENGKTRVDFAASIDNAKHILSTAQSLCPTLMVGPAPIGDRSQNLRSLQLSQQFAQICAKLNMPYLDIFTPLQSSGIWEQEALENDGAHPRQTGYAELAQLVQTWAAWQLWIAPSIVSATG